MASWASVGLSPNLLASLSRGISPRLFRPYNRRRIGDKPERTLVWSWGAPIDWRSLRGRRPP